MSSNATVVVAEAAEPIELGIWMNALKSAGIDARTYERSASAAFGGVQGQLLSSHPVVVPFGQLADAQDIIAGLAGEERLVSMVELQAQTTRAQRMTIGVAGLVLAAFLLAAILRAVL